MPRKRLPDRLHRHREARAIVLELLVVQVKVKHIPHAAVNTFSANPVCCNPSSSSCCNRISVRLEAAALAALSLVAGAPHSKKLLEDLLVFGLHGREPGQLLSRPNMKTPQTWDVLGRPTHRSYPMVPDPPVHPQQQPPPHSCTGCILCVGYTVLDKLPCSGPVQAGHKPLVQHPFECPEDLVFPTSATTAVLHIRLRLLLLFMAGHNRCHAGGQPRNT
mmetsp:Transcript_41741/g.116374  ORF Transcript_41741/g.116374 Transcript_41741/m.116374 type:complete len:219 (+) Transcript_41741:518-1174(+)